jgi:hypothetical protein
MKKEQIMPLAFLIAGIAGGAFAFKSKKFGLIELYGCDVYATQSCTLDKGPIYGCVSPLGTNFVYGVTSPNPTLSCTTDSDCGVVIFNFCQ